MIDYFRSDYFIFKIKTYFIDIDFDLIQFQFSYFILNIKKLYCFLCFFFNFLMSVMMGLVSVLFGFFNLIILYFLTKSVWFD
jgi:hypothetical protein